MNRRDFLKQATSAGILGSTVLHAPLPGTPVAEDGYRALQQRVRGVVLLPGDRDYEASCRLWTGGIPKRPALVARCTCVQDVAAAVGFARERDLPLAVRCGGHTLNGTCEDGLLINLADMGEISVQAEARRVQVQAGCLTGAIDQATTPFGLAAVLGECPTVGIGGLTLGGGLGRLMGRHGALCDTLLAAEVVTANGRILRVSAKENSDLFWAIRGGGGNFGVVTSLTFQLFPVGEVVAGMLRYPIGQTRSVLRTLAATMASAPDGLDALVEIGCGILQYAPDAVEPTVVVNICWNGPLEQGEKVLRPLRSLKPTSDTIRPMSYLSAQELGDVRPLLRCIGTGYPGYRKSGFVATLNEAAIGVLLAACSQPPSSVWSVALDHYMHGAVCRVPTEAMAFSLRQPGFSMRAAAFNTDDGDAKEVKAWVQTLTQALEPFSDGRIYFNYLTDQGPAGVRAALGDNYARLVALKQKYDPTNLFRHNPNIEPI